MHNFLAECQRIMQENGLVPNNLITDGQLHRCPTADKPQGKDGAYIVHLDTPCSLWWCNHRTGESGTHTAKAEGAMSKAERRIFNERVVKEKAQREADCQQRHSEAAQKAQYILSQAQAADDSHPYLQRKQVPALGVKLSRDGSLMVPVFNEEGKAQSLQFINENGDKRFLAGGKIDGGFFPIAAKNGSTSETLCIAEGYATAASIHLATGYAVLIAFNAGNIFSVAQMARRKYPERKIIICADNDHHEDASKPNVGIEAARKAAKSTNSLLAVCPLIDDKKADFNDLHVAQGLEAVKDCIDKAVNPHEVQQAQSEPLPLRKPPQEQEPYPLEALGKVGQVVQVVAEHVAAPIPMVAASLLSALSLCAQRLGNVSHEGRTVLLSLYFLTIAGSGDRKSTVDDIMTAVIRDHEDAQFQTYKEALHYWKIEMRAFDVARKHIEKGKDFALIKQSLMELGAEPQKPASPRILCSNVNVEGMYKMFLDGVHSLGLFSDEAGTFFGGTGFSNENKLKTIAFLASLWSSGRADKMRMGEGDSHITNKRLAAHLMLQPVIAEQLFADELLQQQGFFPRFLVTASKSLKGTRLKDGANRGDIRQHKALQSFNNVCHRLLLQEVPTDKDGTFIFNELTLTTEAENIYRNFYNGTEQEQGENGELANVSNYASRCAEQALRLAGVLAIAQDPTAKSIDGDTMRNASMLALWYLAEAKRLMDDSGVSAEILRAEKLLKWLTTNGEKTVTTQKMVRNTRLKDTQEVKDALKLLQEHGYVNPAPKGIVVNGQTTNNAWEFVLC